ncbi:hypothetical protein ACLESD_46180, partial [Pyxidicoccus sp. 3LFB2]
APWCDAPLDAWAPTYDGSVWFAAAGSTVMMVDALAPGLRALWRVTEVPGPVRALAVDAARLNFLTYNLEQWTYDLPQGPTLRGRGAIATAQALLAGTFLSVSLIADGETVVVVEFPVPGPPGALDSASEPVPLRGRVRGSWLAPMPPRKAASPTFLNVGRAAIYLSESWRVDMVRDEAHSLLTLTDLRDTTRGQLTFEGAAKPHVRLTDSALLAFDARGRVLWVDLEEGTARHVAVE